MNFIYFIIVSVPLYLVRFSVFGFRTNILDILLLLFIIWQIITLVGQVHRPSWSGRFITSIKIKQYLWPIILIVIGASIATARSTDILVSLGILKSWFILPILFFIAGSDIVKSDNQKINILKIWAWIGFIVAVVSLFYYVSGNMTYDGRLEAFFQSPNHLAMFLAPAFLIGIFILANGHVYHQQAGKWLCLPAQANSNAKNGVFWGIAVIFIGITIFLTKSLGGMIAIFISLLPVFYRQIKYGKNKIIVFLILMSVVFSLLFLVLEKDLSDRSSLSSRFIIWSSATEILKDNAIFGIGPGTFQEEYLAYQGHFKPYLEWAAPQPHNIFLAFWLQTGIMGFAGFLWLLFVFFKDILANKDNKIILLCGELMIYFLVHGLIDTTYWKNDLSIMFWLIILVSLKLNNKIKHQ